jgi:general secretion pathway protein H
MMPRRSRTGDGGFTLLELLVTMTIAGLLVSVVAPRLLDTAAHARLRTAAERMAVTLREARATARRTVRADSIVIDPAGKGYGAAGKDFLLPAGEAVSFKPYFERPEAENNALTFLPDGSSSGGTVVFTHGVDSVRVDVDWLTGRVSVGD